MEQPKVLNVAIVGGGRGCKAIMDMIFAEKLTQLRMKLIGVACTNPSAVGYRYAQEKGIYTTKDYRDLYSLKDLDMIIELTGREEVSHEMCRTKPVHVRLMDHAAARLFWDIFQMDEEKIAERQRVLDVLEESETRLRLILETMPSGLFTVGLTRKITSWNSEAEKITGIKAEEVIGRDCLGAFECEECRKGCALLDNNTDKPIYRQECTIRVAGRDITILKNTAVLTDSQGNIIGGLESFIDITEQRLSEAKKKKLEARLQKAEKERMEARLQKAQKMEAIGTLAGGVAHDFNNLLTAIQGFTEMATMQVDKADTLYRYLEQIRNASMRAASLTRQLLLFSRKQPMEFTLISINRTVEDLLKMLHRLIGEDIASNFDLQPDVWTVRADAGKIEQVIMNMVVNARDAMPKGGELTIKTKDVTLDEKDCKTIPESRPGKFVCLSFADTGVGMKKEVLNRIFEPFFTTKGPGVGTGLGLSSVYGIVKQHKGWINVYSKPRQGSTFKVYLPAFSIEPQDEVEEEETVLLHEIQGRGERILLVEDEAQVREFATSVLRENGYVVFEAADVKEAIDIFETEKGDFHLVFSDVVLPDQSALELVDQLLSSKPELRVLLTSGYTDEKSRWSVIRQKGFRFLQKPYSILDLLQAVREVVESK